MDGSLGFVVCLISVIIVFVSPPRVGGSVSIGHGIEGQGIGECRDVFHQGGFEIVVVYFQVVDNLEVLDNWF